MAVKDQQESQHRAEGVNGLVASRPSRNLKTGVSPAVGEGIRVLKGKGTLSVERYPAEERLSETVHGENRHPSLPSRGVLSICWDALQTVPKGAL